MSTAWLCESQRLSTQCAVAERRMRNGQIPDTAQAHADAEDAREVSFMLSTAFAKHAQYHSANDPQYDRGQA